MRYEPSLCLFLYYGMVSLLQLKKTTCCNMLAALFKYILLCSFFIIFQTPNMWISFLVNVKIIWRNYYGIIFQGLFEVFATSDLQRLNPSFYFFNIQRLFIFLYQAGPTNEYVRGVLSIEGMTCDSCIRPIMKEFKQRFGLSQGAPGTCTLFYET